jgi:integrase
MGGRLHNRLHGKQVEKAKPGLWLDGDGLYLQVTASDDGKTMRRSWVFRYELFGQRHELGLGPLRDVGLAQARAKRGELRAQLRDGIDPFHFRKQQRDAARLEQMKLTAERAKALTFQQCAEQCMAAHRAGWTNVKHAEQWQNSLRNDVYPVIGKLNVADVSTAHVVQVLEKIWTKKPETASRVRGRIEKVLAWATVRGFRTGDNPARWRGHLAELFPAKGKVAQVEHHPALSYDDLPAFMSELRARKTTGARALEFLILSAARTAEVTHAIWDADEIDTKGRLWTVPAKRMKRRKPHSVPLSSRCVEILQSLPRHGRYVFGGTQPLDKHSMPRLLHSMRPSGATVHGFRSTFRTWASERTIFPREVCEQALAHTVGSKVEQAYNRGELLAKRRLLMQAWTDFCGRPLPAGATVTPMRKVGAP